MFMFEPGYVEEIDPNKKPKTDAASAIPSPPGSPEKLPTKPPIDFESWSVGKGELVIRSTELGRFLETTLPLPGGRFLEGTEGD